MRFLLAVLGLTACGVLHAHAQPQHLTLQQTTYTGAVVFTAVESITAGRDLVVADGADVTFQTRTTRFLPPFTVQPGGRLTVLADRSVAVEETDPELPATLVLHGAYPNPFRQATSLAYELPRAAAVEVVVFDLLGRAVYRAPRVQRSAGRYVFQWRGVDAAGAPLPAGPYFVRVQAGNAMRTGAVARVE